MPRFIFIYEQRGSFNYKAFTDYLWSECTNLNVLTAKKYPKHKFAKIDQLHATISVELGVSTDTAQEIAQAMVNLGFMDRTNEWNEAYYFYPAH